MKRSPPPNHPNGFLPSQQHIQEAEELQQQQTWTEGMTEPSYTRDSSSYTEDAFNYDSPLNTPQAMLTTSSASTSQHNQNNKNNVQFKNLNLVQDVRSHSESSDHNDVDYAELAQPRAEIILRWKRFAILVILACVALSGFSALLVMGIPVGSTDADKAESRVELFNSYSGVLMGFVECIVGLLLDNLFPVYIVYLHNLKWFPGDNPAEKRPNKFKRILLMLFIPVTMVALCSGFSAVQANQKSVDEDDETTSSRMRTRHLQQLETSTTITASLLKQVGLDPLEETILRTAMMRQVVPLESVSLSTCTDGDGANELTVVSQAAVTFGFPLTDWMKEIYPVTNGEEQIAHSVSFNLRDANEDLSHKSRLLSDIMELPTAIDLITQGKAVFQHSVHLKNKKNPKKKPSSIDHLTEILEKMDGIDSVSALLHSIAGAFHDSPLDLLDVDALNVTFQNTNLNSLMNVQTMAIEIPVFDTRQCEASEDGGCENPDETIVCGSKSCGFLSIAQALPRPQVSMMQSLNNCSVGNLDSCIVERNAAFLYGFTSNLKENPVPMHSNSTSSAHALNLRRSLVFSFGKLSWRFEELCEAADVDDESYYSSGDCQVLHHQLTPSSRHLIVGQKFLPSKLHTSTVADPIRLVQLIQPKVMWNADYQQEAAQFGTLEYLPATSVKRANAFQTKACTEMIDVYLRHIETNHFYLDNHRHHLVQTMTISGLLYLLQHATILESAPTVHTAVARRLQTSQNQKIDVYLSNTLAGNIATWLGCGILFILTLLVLVVPNERARLEPPKGGNARAERFVAVQTEEVYPNFIYKKRFLIGKTGEEIKFREFAVESVGLHHKMEEDEQIYL